MDHVETACAQPRPWKHSIFMKKLCWEGGGDEASVRCWEVILAVTKSTSMANKKQTSKK